MCRVSFFCFCLETRGYEVTWIVEFGVFDRGSVLEGFVRTE